MKRFQTRMQIFLICILIRQQKTRGDKQLYLITHFTKQTLKTKLFTANVECNGTVLKEPKTEKAFLFLNLNRRSMVATSCFGSLVVHFQPIKWH